MRSQHAPGFVSASACVFMSVGPWFRIPYDWSNFVPFPFSHFVFVLSVCQSHMTATWPQWWPMNQSTCVHDSAGSKLHIKISSQNNVKSAETSQNEDQPMETWWTTVTHNFSKMSTFENRFTLTSMTVKIFLSYPSAFEIASLQTRRLKIIQTHKVTWLPSISMRTFF